MSNIVIERRYKEVDTWVVVPREEVVEDMFIWHDEQEVVELLLNEYVLESDAAFYRLQGNLKEESDKCCAWWEWHKDGHKIGE